MENTYTPTKRVHSRLSTIASTWVDQKIANASLLLEVLMQVNSLMGLERGFESFCGDVVKILKEKLKFKYIHIWIQDERYPTVLRLVTPERVNKYRTTSIHSGIVGKAIREKKTICVPDVSKEPAYLNYHPEVVSEICVPLIESGMCIGALNIETDVLQTFEGQIPLIESIAENLSHSLKLALLYKTQESFHRLVDNMSEGVWVGDGDEKTIYTNPTLQKMVGVSERQFLNLTSFDFFDEESKKLIALENKKRKRGLGGHYEAMIISRTGEKVPVIIHAVPFGEEGTMATITDLRKLHAAEKKLAHVERYLAAITQYSQEAIVGFDEKGVVRSWNIGAETMFGYKAHEMMGHLPEKLYPKEIKELGEFDRIMQEAKAKGCVRNHETVRMHKTGTRLDISLTVSAIKDDRGKIIGFSGIYRDITAQKKWERELQDRFEKMQDAYKEMGRQRRYLDYLTDLIKMTTDSGNDRQQVATFIVSALVIITKVDGATLRFFDKTHGKLHLIAQSGLGEEWWHKKNIAYKGSLLETAAQKGGPLKILDILATPRYGSPSLARKNNLRSALVIPLIVNKEVLGSITLYLQHEGNLGLLDDEFITIFSKQAALALKMAPEKKLKLRLQKKSGSSK